MTDEITRWRKSGGYGTRNYLYFREMFPELDDQIIDQFKLGFGATIIYEDMSREEIGKLIYNAIAIGFVSGKQLSDTASAVWDKAVEECMKEVREYREGQTESYESAEGEGAQLVFTGAIMAAGAMIDRFSSLKRSDKTDTDDLCQAKSSAQGETVSAPAEPLQLDLVAEAWRPISTAPHDREVLVGTAGDQFGTEVAKYDFTFKIGEGWYAVAEWMDPQPTHWMPLPPHPRYPIEEPERSAGDEVSQHKKALPDTPSLKEQGEQGDG